jgi:hypothetical protein
VVEMVPARPVEAVVEIVPVLVVEIVPVLVVDMVPVFEKVVKDKTKINIAEQTMGLSVFMVLS